MSDYNNQYRQQNTSQNRAGGGSAYSAYPSVPYHIHHQQQQPPVLVRPLPTPQPQLPPNSAPASSSSSSTSIYTTSTATRSSSQTTGYVTTPSDDGYGHGRRPSGPLAVYRSKDSTPSHPSPTSSHPPGRAPSPLPPVPSSSHQQHHHFSSTSAPYSPSINSYSSQSQSHGPQKPLSSSSTSSNSSSRSSYTPLAEGTFCTATKDHETYSYVDLSGCPSPAALRETVLTKLHIGDDEFWACEFYPTRIGTSKSGGGGGSSTSSNNGTEPKRMSGDDLWAACARSGDSGFTVLVKMRHGSPSGDYDLPAGASAAATVRYEGGGGGLASPTTSQQQQPYNCSLTRRTKSPSVSSRSDKSSPFSPAGGAQEYGFGQGGGVNEMGEVVGSGSRGDARSWPSSGEGHRQTASHGSLGGAGGSLSPPIDGRGRAGSLTPTAPHPEDFAWGSSSGDRHPEDPRRNGESMRRPSAPALSLQMAQQQQQQQPPRGSHDVIMGPSGPIRRLPGPPSQAPPPQQQQSQPQHQYSYSDSADGDRRQRTQTAPGSVGAAPPQSQPPPPPSSAGGWTRSPPTQYPHQPPPSLQPAVRPLPSTGPSPVTPSQQAPPQPPQFNIPSQTSSQYHNLKLQDRDAFRNPPPLASPHLYQRQQPPPPQQHSHAQSLGLPPRQVMMTKSADNLREHYIQAFDPDLRPGRFVTTSTSQQSQTSLYRGGGPPQPPPVPPVPPVPPSLPAGYSAPPRPPQPPYGAGTYHPVSQSSIPPPSPVTRQPPPSQPHHQPSYPPPQPYHFNLRDMRPGGGGPATPTIPSASVSLPANHSLPLANVRQAAPLSPVVVGGGGLGIASPVVGPGSKMGGSGVGDWPPQRRTTSETVSSQQQQQQWNPYMAQSRYGAPPPPQPPSVPPMPPSMPDVSKAIPLQPGDLLQHAHTRAATATGVESSQSPTSPTSHRAPPPAAVHMRANDPSLAYHHPPPNSSSPDDMWRSSSTSSAYGPEAVPQPKRESGGSATRRDSPSSGSRRRSEEHSRDRRPSKEILGASVGTNVSTGSSGRGGGHAPADSWSSLGSSASQQGVAAAPTVWKPHRAHHTPASSQDETAYDGLHDEHSSAVYASPPSSSSARSSTSASGPITPISTNVAAQIHSSSSHDIIADAAKQTAPTGEAWGKAIPHESPTPMAMPLPGSGESEDQGEDTLRASEDWRALVDRAFDGSPKLEETTLNATNTATIRPPAEVEEKKDLATETTPPAASPQPSKPAEPVAPTFSSYEDDDEEETSTYLPGFGPPRVKDDSSPVGVTLVDAPKSRSPASERRPTLPRLKIETPPSSSLNSTKGDGSDLKSADSEKTGLSRRIAASPASRRLNALSNLSESGSNIVRRGSFAERAKVKEDWAFRPKVEDVLENLEDFFPEYDLEKPVFDAPTPTPITPSPDTTSPAREQAPAKATLKRASAQLGYKKSIRVVAGDRKRNMLKASAREKQQPGLASNVPASVMRRKSTKLFGSRLEEVTPSQVKQMDPTIPESPPDDDPDNFSFKWIKGEMIGRGSYGKVYIAFNVTAGEAIAVKQVELPRTASDKEDKRLQGMVASLKAEIELLKDLSHDNIVEYLGMEETPEYLSIFLEYVPGGSVGRIIRTHGKFPEDVIKHFTFQILTGLRYLHNLGILHRDLKGDNILCDQDGVCKISDFGTSKKSQDIYNNDVNMSMQGSIFWMAPEVIQNESRGYSAKADIWSLGCLCLEMFAGRRPWDQNEILATMFKLGAEKRAPPVPDDVILSDLAKAFFNACFQGDPDLRPRADQLMRHRFLELGPDYAFTKTSLYKAIASTPNTIQSPSP